MTTIATTDIDLDLIVGILKENGIHAYVEQTGGGCATIYAGPKYKDSDDYDRWAAIAGPGWFEGPNWTLGRALRSDFYIGPDDDGEDQDAVVCTTESTTDDEIVELIYTQVLKTCALLRKQAEYRAANPL